MFSGLPLLVCIIFVFDFDVTLKLTATCNFLFTCSSFTQITICTVGKTIVKKKQKNILSIQVIKSTF